MTLRQNEEHERLLQALACGDLDIDAPALCALRRADAQFDRKVRDLCALREGLDHLAREEREVLGGVPQAPRPADAEFVASRLRSFAGGSGAQQGSRSRPGGRKRWPWVLLTAAAGVMIAFLLFELRDRPDRSRTSDLMLSGASAVELLQPEDGGAYDPARGFSWRYDLGPGERFEFVLVERLPDGRQIERSSTVHEVPWFPAAEVRAKWPRRGTWSVRVLSTTGDLGVMSDAREVSFE